MGLAAVLVLAGAVSVGGALVGPGAPSMEERAAPDCAGPIREEPSVGRACPTVHGGWRTFFADGTSQLFHIDRPEMFPQPDEPGTQAVTPQQPICVADPATEYHNYAIYLVDVDGTDNYSTKVGTVRTKVKEINGWLRAEAAENGRFMDYRVRCLGGGDTTIAVANVRLTIQNPVNPDDLVNDLKAQGYNSVYAKYWIFYDMLPSGVCAWGYVPSDDDQPGVGNANNVGPGYALAYNNCWTWSTVMHEVTHSHGAVVATAPHSDYGATGQHHCTDEYDIMCYPNPQVCGFDGGNSNFDCNHDDYFHAGTPSGWLATHWNLGHSNHRVILKQSDCNTNVEAPGTFAAAVTITLPQTNCPGALNKDGGDADDWFKFTANSGQVIKATMTPNSQANFNVCIWKPSQVQAACSNTGGLGGTETATFTADATGSWRVRPFTGQGTGNGLYTLSVCLNC